MANIKRIDGKGSVSYKITVSAGRDINNRQIRHFKTYKPDPGMTERQIAKELNRVAVEFESSVEQGLSVDGSIKFKDFADMWLDLNQDRFAPITYARYETLLIRINQAIGHIRLSKLQPIHLTAFYNDLRTVESERTGRLLSQQTIRHYHRCVSAILSQATREGVITRNIASRDFIDTPKTDKKEPVHLNDEQACFFVEMLATEPDIRVKTALSMLLYSGCRIGELTGLEWSDCYFESQRIQIKRCSQYCKGKGMITKEPKNKTSARTIRLPQSVFTLLAEYRRWYREQRLMYGDLWVNSDRLFIQADGKPIAPPTINLWLSKFVKKHNLPDITPHGLRHTNITLLIANGVDIRTVSAKAGHSRTSTTLDIYSHAVQSADEIATQVLEDALLRKNKDVR